MFERLDERLTLRVDGALVVRSMSRDFLQSPSHRAKADGSVIGPSPTDQKRGRYLRSCMCT
jgi:hypothetical protein